MDVEMFIHSYSYRNLLLTSFLKLSSIFQMNKFKKKNDITVLNYLI